MSTVLAATSLEDLRIMYKRRHCNIWKSCYDWFPRWIWSSRQGTEIRRVTVAGITGAIGPAIVHALVEAGFEVQAFTRTPTQDISLPVSTTVVNYNDVTTLRDLLRGQDAVVSCLGDTPGAVAAQAMLIQAAFEAGVKRFLPSEYGSDTTNDRVMSFPFFSGKIAHQNLLKKLAVSHQAFSYTVLITGIWLDWSLSVVPCIINVGDRTAQIYDGGDTPFSITRSQTVAQAVVKILQKPDSTRNRILHIHETTTSQNELIKLLKTVTHRCEFAETHIDSQQYEASAWKAYQNGGNALDWIIPFINLSIWSREALCDFESTDNDLLGIQELHGHKRNRMLERELLTAIKAYSGKPTDPNPMSTKDEKSSASLAVQAYDAGRLKLIEVS